MDKPQLVKAYLGELLDRIYRLEIHFCAVEKEFYRRASERREGNDPREHPLFLDSFRECVDKLLLVVFRLGEKLQGSLSDGEFDAIMYLIRHGFIGVNELHQKGLVHLPRPSEPIELRRFLRVISRHVLTRSRPDLSVYITEDTTESSFADDPAALLKISEIASFVSLANGFIEEKIETEVDINTENGIHVTIARIDSHNPLRWPTLMHEAAHKLLSKETIGDSPLKAQFEDWAPSIVLESFGKLSIDLDSWLTETWCDLFGSLVLGPAFYFSQFAAFVGSPCVESKIDKYPPSGIRLRLILDCLRHRHPGVTNQAIVRSQMLDSLEIVEYWDTSNGVDIGSNYHLKVAYDAMRGFYLDKFFSGPKTEGENFQNRFVKMVQYVRELQLAQLEEIQESIAQGLPAPSKPHRSGVALAEEPTSIQEVLLAAWLDRLTRLRQESLDALLVEALPLKGAAGRDGLLKSVTRFDDAILRSIQLAEWLHVLSPPEPKDVVKQILKNDSEEEEANHLKQLSVLNDAEITQLIQTRQLRVVPLVDLDQQLGSTSLDIRLGTSFEVYLSAYRRNPGIEDGEIAPYDSRAIDLDFLEHMVLLPGQMVLAHSFEYLKLPPDVAGDLEGRSSYARLGLEVHQTAGMIDPGFEGVITLELVNNGPNPIPLFPGLRIAQLRLVRVKIPSRPYSSRHTAKYKGLLHHHTSLYMNDPDFKHLKESIRALQSCREKDPQAERGKP